MSATAIKLPDVGENIESVHVVSWLVAVGEMVRKGQSIAEVMTDKVTVEVPADCTGTVQSLAVNVGDEVAVGGVLLVLAPGPESAPVPTAPPTTDPSRPLIAAGPGVRRLARERGLDLAQVRGTAYAGRITREDVFGKVESVETVAPARTATLPDFARWGEVETKPLDGVRRATAAAVTAAWREIPHVTQHDEADITALQALRAQLAPQVERRGGKLTVTAVLLRVIAGALSAFPEVCASLDLERNQIVYKRYRHVGVAVDTDRGLLVPVIRDVDRKGLVELAIELKEVGERARAARLSIEDMRGGCFTISNLGGLGTTSFSPIVRWPEVAILGVGRAQRRPTYVGDELQPRLMMPLSLSYDHRAVDGAQAARFLRWVAERLEQPLLLALG
jgi:pyruvate dehydrogenase E2 component (dihydrolipoamide acetyltransferase)